RARQDRGALTPASRRQTLPAAAEQQRHHWSISRTIRRGRATASGNGSRNATGAIAVSSAHAHRWARKPCHDLVRSKMVAQVAEELRSTSCCTGDNHPKPTQPILIGGRLRV